MLRFFSRRVLLPRQARIVKRLVSGFNDQRTRVLGLGLSGEGAAVGGLPDVMPNSVELHDDPPTVVVVGHAGADALHVGTNTLASAARIRSWICTYTASRWTVASNSVGSSSGDRPKPLARSLIKQQATVIDCT